MSERLRNSPKAVISPLLELRDAGNGVAALSEHVSSYPKKQT